MENWTVDPADVEGPYAPSCSSRAAEGFYSGALLGAIWGVVAQASSTEVEPRRPPIGRLGRLSGPSPNPGGGVGEARGYLRALGKGVTGYARSSVSSAGVFGVFVGVLNATTCASERFRGEKDWKNNMCGGGAGGFSVAVLSRHTRTPRLVAAYAVGGAAITSLAALITGGSSNG